VFGFVEPLWKGSSAIDDFIVAGRSAAFANSVHVALLAV
jgi:hypothetical protein